MPDENPSSREAKPLSRTAAQALIDLGFHAAEPTEEAEAAPGRLPGEKAGDLVGRYRLIERLGEGGFGVVWHAEQREPIHRELALKLIKPGMDSHEIIARFEAESQALAMMDHPNIAAVLDAGATADGRPYFAMERVHGEPLTRYCDSRRLDLRERLALFIPVCRAVQHAHQKAILHRDLKPSNILIAEVDGRPVPKVIDFGIAKALGPLADPEQPTGLLDTGTGIGAIVGTLQYMSPEQAGSVPDVDTRSDIYSLGVILYELLTGRAPIEPETPAFDEMLRRIRNEEAPKPSSRVQGAGAAVSEAARLRGTDPGRLRRALAGDLDWIATKALEKDRRRRYETALALALDLERHLQQQPVSAAAPGWSYRFSKFARRNRAALTAAALVSLALIAGSAVSLWQAAEARMASAKAGDSRREAEANLRKAREAVELYLSRVTDDPRLNQADFQPLRRELLETALPFYEDFAKREGADPALQADRTWALSRLAGIHQSLGDHAKAEEICRQAMAIEEKLVADFPANAGYRAFLAMLCNNLGVILQSRRDFAGALASKQRAIPLCEGLAKEFPDDPRRRHDLSTSLVNLALALISAGQKPEAESALQRSAEIARRLVADYPDRPEFAGQLAYSLSNLADVTEDVSAAEKTYREALAIQEKIATQVPANHGFRGAVATTCHNLGSLLALHGRLKEGLPFQLRAVEINRGLAAEFPSLEGYHRALATNGYMAGDTLLKLGRLEEAEAHQLEVLAILRLLISQHPDSPDFEYTTGLALESLAQMRSATRRWPEACDFYRQGIVHLQRALAAAPGHAPALGALRQQLTRLGEACLLASDGPAAMQAALDLAAVSDLAEDCEPIAALLARAIPLLERDTSLDEARRREAIARSRDGAIARLQRALELGHTDVATLQADEKWAALRSFPDFAGLQDPPPDPVDGSPSRFTFDYRFSDPGKRIWTREGKVWTELQPSGSRRVFETVARRRVKGVSGTEIAAPGDSMRIFVPDRGTREPMRLLMSRQDGVWTQIGAIADVE